MQSLNNDHGLLVWGDSWRKRFQTFNDLIDRTQSISLGGKARGNDSKEESDEDRQTTKQPQIVTEKLHELDMRNESRPIDCYKYVRRKGPQGRECYDYGRDPSYNVQPGRQHKKEAGHDTNRNH
jgi:hypothetical protein